MDGKTEPLWWTIVRLLRWDKPEGRLILMVPALWALCLAAVGKPDIPLLVVIILGSVATSAAGCVVNDLWDRNIDPQVQRTSSRPLASRALSIKTGIAVAIVAFACAAGLAVYLNPWRNPLSFWLAIAAVPVIVLYPLAKRVFPIPQLVLSVAWGFAVLISWTAVTARLQSETWLLWAATILWTLGFDTIYAMADREDDRRIGVNSSALFFGKFAPHAVGLFFFGTVVLLSCLGTVLQLTIGFWVSLVLAATGWTQQYRKLRHHNLSSSEYGQMFRQNVWLGFLLLLGMELGLLL